VPRPLRRPARSDHDLDTLELPMLASSPPSIGRILFATAMLLVSTAASAEPGGLAGTWTVSATPTASTGIGSACPRDHDANGTWQWVVAVQRDGSVTATVTGLTGFSTLTGRVDGNHLRLSGRKAGNVGGLAGVRLDELALFELDLAGSALSGTRTWLGYAAGGQDGGTATLVPAACAWRVTGRR
jgi:hypothetical protein